MCNEHYDLQKSLGFLTITANRLMSAFFRKQLAEAGIELTAEQWGVLIQLWNRLCFSQEELAHALCVDKSSLSRVLDVMERKGLVTRRRDPDDARRKLLSATPESDGLKPQCRQVADSTMVKILKGIDPAELDTCLKVLAEVKANLRELSE